MPERIAMNCQKDKTVAFSGHRIIRPPTQAGLFAPSAVNTETYLESIVAKLRETVTKLKEEGFDTFLCGMAAGFDLMAGMEVCRLIEERAPLSLIALIPHPGQASRLGRDERRDYVKVLSMARETHIVCPEYRKECFHMRNDLLVDYSSTLVCYYDGSAGGTHYTVKRALKQGSRVINIF